MFDLYIIRLTNPENKKSITIREGRKVFQAEHIHLIQKYCADLLDTDDPSCLKITVRRKDTDAEALCIKEKEADILISDDLFSCKVLMSCGALGSYGQSIFDAAKDLKGTAAILNKVQKQSHYVLSRNYHLKKEKVLFLTLGGGKFPNGTLKLMNVLSKPGRTFTDMDHDFLSVSEQDELDDETRNDIIKIANTVEDFTERKVQIQTRLMQYGLKANKLEDFVYAYKDTRYRFANHHEYHSQLVAEPLIKEYKPDRIFMIGTAGSLWADLYLKFSHTIDTREYYDILRMVESSTSSTGSREIAAIQKKLAKYFTAERLKEGTPDIAPVIVRYGYDARQQEENYRILSRVWENSGFAKNQEYEVAFDITHSFRSLPIYNMVILNYYKLVSDYHIHISHIFYGNQEAIREIGYAPIMDLAGMENILELSNAVSTFKSTGSAKDLVSAVGKNDPSLKKALDDFDWALTINDLDGTVAGIAKLLKVCSARTPRKSAYTDLRSMIQSMIESTILKDARVPLDNLINLKAHPKARAEIQYLLSRWFIENGQYGIASADTQEAMITYLAILKYNNPTTKDLTNSNNRDDVKNVIEADIPAWLRLSQEEQKLYEKYKDAFANCRFVRNKFAHNLSADIAKNGEDERKIKTPKQVQDIIRTMLDCVKEIRSNYLNQSTDPEARHFVDMLKHIYFSSPKKQNQDNNKNACKTTQHAPKADISSGSSKPKQDLPKKAKTPAASKRLVISTNAMDSVYKPYAKKKNGQNVEVDALPDSVIQLIKADYRNQDASAMLRTGQIIADVLKNSGFSDQSVIYLVNLTVLQNTMYTYALNNTGYGNVILNDAKQRNLKGKKPTTSQSMLWPACKKAYEGEEKKNYGLLEVKIKA